MEKVLKKLIEEYKNNPKQDITEIYKLLKDNPTLFDTYIRIYSKAYNENKILEAEVDYFNENGTYKPNGYIYRKLNN